MKINEEILHRIEALAKLHVDEKDRQESIEKIIKVLDMLDKVDNDALNHLEPLYHPLEIAQVLRADIADKDIDREQLQQNAPSVEDGLFLVPKVIE